MTRYQEKYRKEIVPAMMEHFGYKNINQVPRLDKIVLNMGMGNATQNVKLIDQGLSEMGRIAGQQPKVTRAKLSIANFKLRKGMPIGCMVTLRKYKMFDFLDRLINIAIPRVRDFRGIPADIFDGRGNYSFGMTEQIVFPEIEYDKVDSIRGLNITIVTTAKTDEEAFQLLKLFGFPFSR
ncbi:50S ribosomal protein L5 [bacterium]|nr:50S ribosomal protein L5 [bacterium]